MSIEIISSRKFGIDDQLWFAERSGDWNPLHLDPIAARRLLFGEVIVHGMHGLLWALDAHCANDGACPATIAASFHRPLLLNVPVTVAREPSTGDGVLLTLRHEDEILASFLLSGTSALNQARVPGGHIPRRSPRELTISALKTMQGQLDLRSEVQPIAAAFPHAVAKIGLLPVTAILRLSEIVGMECPGLHSLYARLDVALVPADQNPSLAFRVIRCSTPQAPIQMELAGGGIQGTISAFYRPSPAEQPTMDAVVAAVPAAAFADQHALIVGGSRGLGELTAKVVAAGGGAVVLTYQRGANDADRVAAEITKSGGRCTTMALDLSDPEAAAAAALALPHLPSHVYFFAAPRIRRSRSGRYDPSLAQTFQGIFVESFASLIIGLAERSTARLRVFYPSSVFIDELPKEYCEYIVAKAAGETLCQFLIRHYPQLSIMVQRLPRLPTDQTSALIRRDVPDPLPIIVDIVGRMHGTSLGTSALLEPKSWQ
jgi:hypothetical protein